MINIASLVIGIAGVLMGFWFGVRSMFQSQDLEALQTAVRAYNQGLFNNVWRMGANAESALKAAKEAEARELIRGVADMSQTARHVMIAFSREHSQLIPYKDEAWESHPRPPEVAGKPPEKPFWRRFFRV
jgi:hypothetical protein